MASQQQQKETTKNHTCVKCGSVMARRMITESNGNGEPKLIKIFQCKVCKHWRYA